MMAKTSLERRIFAPEPGISTGLSQVKPRFGNAKNDELLLELPQHLELLAANLAAGQGFIEALTAQSQSARGKFADHLKRLEKRLRFGSSLEAALRALAEESKSASVTEFANKVELSLIRGTPLADQMSLLADATRTKLRLQILRKAGKNELLMLIPLVFLILPVTVGFAVFPSLQLLRSGL
jgi:tight adherence protein C